MSITNRLVRRAADEIEEIIINAAKRNIGELQDAVNNALESDEIKIYNNPWDIANDEIDSDYAANVFINQANEQVDAIVDTLASNIAVLVSSGEFDDLEVETYQDINAMRAAAVDFLNPTDDELEQINAAFDVTQLCDILNEIAVDQDVEATYVCMETVDELRDDMVDKASDFTGEDLNKRWDTVAQYFFDENKIDENAAYVYIVDHDYVNCMDDHELAEEIIKMTGDQLLNLLAELKSGQ